MELKQNILYVALFSRRSFTSLFSMDVMDVTYYLIESSFRFIFFSSATIEPADEATGAAGLVHRLLFVRFEGVELSLGLVQLLQSLQVNSLHAVIIFFIVLI